MSSDPPKTYIDATGTSKWGGSAYDIDLALHNEVSASFSKTRLVVSSCMTFINITDQTFATAPHSLGGGYFNYASGGGCRGMLDSDTYPDDFYPDKLGEATMDLRGNQFTLASNVRFDYTGWRGQLYSSSISNDRKRAEFSGDGACSLGAPVNRRGESTIALAVLVDQQ
ncbi:uncharacterized protein LOC142339957 [Convolutriloba macropyga]|uniref:uncharacterized protein LOC142339957 n=1 Tax=Convolutriloba macropyga TaxID=536237 RepID=UPI003F51D365